MGGLSSPRHIEKRRDIHAINAEPMYLQGSCFKHLGNISCKLRKKPNNIRQNQPALNMCFLNIFSERALTSRVVGNLLAAGAPHTYRVRYGQDELLLACGTQLEAS
eukprot:4425823-Amphidinium_carterae.1